MSEDRVLDLGADQRSIADVHRRSRNILDVYPAKSWDLAEAGIILAALEAIVRGRQRMGAVIDMPRGKAMR